MIMTFRRTNPTGHRNPREEGNAGQNCANDTVFRVGHIL